MKRSIVSNKIESVESAIKRTANKKNSGRDRLTGEFYQTFVCVCVCVCVAFSNYCKN